MAELTEEQKAVRRANLERARAAKRATREAAAEPVEAMPVFTALVHEAAPEAAEVVEEPTDPALDPFERFLAAQDEETRDLLSDIELRVIFEEETKKAALAKKDAARKAAVKRAERAAKADAGLISSGDLAAQQLRERNSQKVRYTPMLPQTPDGGLIDEGFRVDGRLLFHNMPITVTRAEALSLREMEWRAMSAELDFEGRNRLSQLRRTATGALDQRVL